MPSMRSSKRSSFTTITKAHSIVMGFRDLLVLIKVTIDEGRVIDIIEGSTIASSFATSSFVEFQASIIPKH